jgi:hypothetical protein
MVRGLFDDLALIIADGKGAYRATDSQLNRDTCSRKLASQTFLDGLDESVLDNIELIDAQRLAGVACVFLVPIGDTMPVENTGNVTDCRLQDPSPTCYQSVYIIPYIEINAILAVDPSRKRCTIALLDRRRRGG